MTILSITALLATGWLMALAYYIRSLTTPVHTPAE